MTRITRRHFLQFTGSALAGIGINQVLFQRLAQRYGQVLAQSTPPREININGFKAGIFSYLLTHYLWQEDSNIERLFPKILPEIPRDFNQLPRYEVKVGSEYQRQASYFISSPNSTAQAVVTRVSENNAQLWLGGVDLRKVKAGTLFTAMKGTGQVKVVSRDGLVAQATVEKAVTEGMALRLIG
jgi:hypothetical protein